MVVPRSFTGANMNVVIGGIMDVFWTGETDPETGPRRYTAEVYQKSLAIVPCLLVCSILTCLIVLPETYCKS